MLLMVIFESIDKKKWKFLILNSLTKGNLRENCFRNFRRGEIENLKSQKSESFQVQQFSGYLKSNDRIDHFRILDKILQMFNKLLPHLMSIVSRFMKVASQSNKTSNCILHTCSIECVCW